MQIQLWQVYKGVWGDFPNEIIVELHVQTWRESVRRWPNNPSQHVIIPDNVAQCIASWWHSPGKPYSTLLSTRGIVDRYTTLDDFGDPETDADTREDKDALRALGAYLTAKQNSAESESRPCACHDCFETAVGRPGELCSECAEWGCDATDARAACEVPGAYDEDAGYDPETDCTDPECEGCLYCIPGA